MGLHKKTIPARIVPATVVVLMSIVGLTGDAHGQTAPAKSSNVYPIDLTTALRLAGTNNLQIAEAEARVREVSGDKLSTYERFFPSLAAEWLLLRHEGRTQATEGEFLDVDKQFNRAGSRLAATWDLNDALFSLLATRRKFEVAEHARDNAEDSTLLEVANAYFVLTMAEVRTRIAQRAIDVSADFVEQSERSVREGVGFQVDVLRAKTQLVHDKLRLQQAREESANASARLAALLNLEEPITLAPLDTMVVPLTVADTSEPVQEWINQALENHPYAQMQRSRVEAARIEKTQALWGPLLPKVEGQALFSGFGPTWSDLRRSRDYSVSFQWTIGPGGLFDLGRIRSNSARLESQELKLELAQNAIVEQVIRSRGQIRIRAAMLEVAQEGRDAARETLRLAQGRRELGIGLALEVFIAAEALTRAESDYANAVVDYNRVQVEVLAVLGRLDSVN